MLHCVLHCMVLLLGKQPGRQSSHSKRAGGLAPLLDRRRCDSKAARHASTAPPAARPVLLAGFTPWPTRHCVHPLQGPMAQLLTPQLAQRPHRLALCPLLLQGELSAGCPDPRTGDCPYNPITVIAPTNAAFLDLAASLNTSLDGLFRWLPLVPAACAEGWGHLACVGCCGWLHACIMCAGHATDSCLSCLLLYCLPVRPAVCPS